MKKEIKEKIKPNETIGIPCFAGMWIFGILGIKLNVPIFLIFALISGFLSMIFLSFWGLWDFNKWFEEKIGSPKNKQ